MFEYVDHTVLGKSYLCLYIAQTPPVSYLFADELEDNPSGLDEDTARKHVFQVLRGVNFCHQNNVRLYP